MTRYILLFLPLLAACGEADTVARNEVPPPLNDVAERPGDWSPLAQMVGRAPAESGLLVNSAITVDLDALLGPMAGPFRQAMATGTPLGREGQVLVTRARGGDAYLLIFPEDHALEAGLRGAGGWQTWTTPGASVPRPPSIERLRGGG